MKWFRWLVISVLVVLITLSGSVASVWASTPVAQAENSSAVSISPAPDGQGIAKVIVSGRPPRGTAEAAAIAPDVHIQGVTDVLSDVPAFDWSYGCSATAAAMLFGYYDRVGYSNMYTGATNSGVCPLDNSIWGDTKYPSVTCGECPLSATHQGVDGRTTKGHVDDYWIDYLNYGPDPYINHWTPHISDCAADFMGTSQSSFGLPDGATAFYYYPSGDPLPDYLVPGTDGTHGLRLFAESRGYTVTACFYQLIQGQGDNLTKGFTFADYMAEIDAGRPVLIQLVGHTMLGYGYDNTSGNIIYVRNTWDYSSHTMTWGGSYAGMQQEAVTVLRLAGAPTTPASLTVVSPNGNESWQTGTSQTIRWTYTGSPGTYVKIELLKSGVLNSTITSSTATSTGSYSWLIPSSQTAGTDYQVRLTSTSNDTITDTSNGNFTITAPPAVAIIVTSPNGGESWRVNTYQTIRWTYTGSPGAYVKIELLKNGVVTRVITSRTSIGRSGSGSYSWRILSSQIAGIDYKVRITSTSNVAITDTSNTNFSITR